MISSVSQPVGTNVKIYLYILKGKKVRFGKGKARKVNVSFKGKIHEIRKDCVVLKGRFVYKQLNGKFAPFPKPGCKKFLLSDIMRIVRDKSSVVV